MNYFKIVFVCCVSCLGAFSSHASLNIIPWPQSVTTSEGVFSISGETALIVSAPDIIPLAEILSNEFAAAFTLNLPVSEGSINTGCIYLCFDTSLTGTAYQINVTNTVTVRAGNYQALAMGTATLLQLAERDGDTVNLPYVTIDDWCYADYSGMMLDVGRQWHPVSILKQCVELARLYKMKYFHLHLTDDQGWTFPSTNYPLLGTQNYAAHGGVAPQVYSREELLALVAYADARGVTIIPEIEMPGHSGAMRRAMPGLFGNLGVINMGREPVYTALSNIIGEVSGIFQSSPYIHIGGDETDMTGVSNDPDCIAYMASNSLASVDDLFKHFLGRVDSFVRSRDKTTIAWEGFSRGGLSSTLTNIVVMEWAGFYYNPVHIVNDGFQIINVPWVPSIYSTQQENYEWNMWLVGSHSRTPDQLTQTNAVIGAQMVYWEQAADTAIPRLREKAPPRHERTWNPFAGKPFSDFTSRFAHVDALLTVLLPPPQVVDVSGVYNEPNLEIGPGVIANMVGDTTFGYITRTCRIPVINNGYRFTIDSGNGNDLNYAGQLSGTGTVEFFMGPYNSSNPYFINNPLRISGTEANTMAGTFNVKKGQVQLEKSPGLNAVSGNLVVGGQGSNDCIYLKADEQIIDSADVILLNSPSGAGKGGYINLNGCTETIASLTMASDTFIRTDGTDGVNGVLKTYELNVNGESKPVGEYTSSEPWIEGGGTVVVLPEPSATIVLCVGIVRLITGSI
jgi:hexosaminidase